MFGTHDLNSNGAFQSVFNFIVQVFHDVWNILDNIKIGSFSILDLFIGLLIMGLIISVTLSTISNFVGNAGERVNQYYNKATDKAIKDHKKKQGG